MIPEKASTTSYVASAGVVVLGYGLNEWLIIVGIFTAIATFGVNWYYKHKHFELVKREQDRLDRNK